MKTNERLQALQVLLRLLKDKASLSSQNTQALTPLAKALCFGFCRHYFRLEVLALTLMAKRPKDLDVWVVILMGLYQLHYMRQPDYAVVKETVALLEKIKKPWAKALVNALLRRFCREKDTILASLAQTPAFNDGHPPWLLDKLKADWPCDWQSIVAANDEHPPMTLRVNSQKISVQDYLKALHEAGMEASSSAIATQSITLLSATEVQDLPGFKEGWFSVQDRAAQLAASLLSLQPGLRVLDACCAPGGKTCHILELEPGLSTCVAMDVDAKRLERVQENLHRLGLKASVVKGDALNPDSWWDGQLFDRILLDAPCSATGVIRRHPDIKLLRTPEDILEITQIQTKMLKALWPLLAPGGLLLYATCSILSLENQVQIDNFVKSQTDCEPCLEEKPWGRKAGHGLQILPGEEGMDGFYYSLLKKKA